MMIIRIVIVIVLVIVIVIAIAIAIVIVIVIAIVIVVTMMMMMMMMMIFIFEPLRTSRCSEAPTKTRDTVDQVLAEFLEDQSPLPWRSPMNLENLDSGEKFHKI